MEQPLDPNLMAVGATPTETQAPTCTCTAIISPFKNGIGQIAFRKTALDCPVHHEAVQRLHREAERHGVTLLPNGKRLHGVILDDGGRGVTPSRSARTPDNEE